jgi:hypothetical protein
MKSEIPFIKIYTANEVGPDAEEKLTEKLSKIFLNPEEIAKVVSVALACVRRSLDPNQIDPFALGAVVTGEKSRGEDGKVVISIICDPETGKPLPVVNSINWEKHKIYRGGEVPDPVALIIQEKNGVLDYTILSLVLLSYLYPDFKQNAQD